LRPAGEPVMKANFFHQWRGVPRLLAPNKAPPRGGRFLFSPSIVGETGGKKVQTVGGGDYQKRGGPRRTFLPLAPAIAGGGAGHCDEWGRFWCRRGYRGPGTISSGNPHTPGRGPPVFRTSGLGPRPASRSLNFFSPHQAGGRLGQGGEKSDGGSHPRFGGRQSINRMGEKKFSPGLGTKNCCRWPQSPNSRV